MICRYPNLELIEYIFRQEIHSKGYLKGNSNFSCSVVVFKQTWGSTALGFGGIGGQAITDAYTTVISIDDENINGVFFGNKLAYIVPKTNRAFRRDLGNFCMADCSSYGKYIVDDHWDVVNPE